MHFYGIKQTEENCRRYRGLRLNIADLLFDMEVGDVVLIPTEDVNISTVRNHRARVSKRENRQYSIRQTNGSIEIMRKL